MVGSEVTRCTALGKVARCCPDTAGDGEGEDKTTAQRPYIDYIALAYIVYTDQMSLVVKSASSLIGSFTAAFQRD